MNEEQNIIKDVYAFEEKIKECINNKEVIPTNLIAILDEAKYAVNRISEIVKIYKVSHE